MKYDFEVKRSSRAAAQVLALALLPLVCVGLDGCGHKKEASPSDSETGTAIGIEHGDMEQPPLASPLRSPAGRLVEPGTVDERGYVLPLDVLALKQRQPREEPVPRPGARELKSMRALRTSDRSRFEEHRLGPDDGHTQNETTIAADGQTLVAGWNNFDDSGLLMGVARSTDGGHSWTSDVFSGHTVTSDPAVKAGGSGKWYYAYLASGGPGGNDIDIYVRRSIDNAATWQGPVAASQNANFDDKPYIDARGDEVLVGWADFGYSPAKVSTSRSLDGGLTFGATHVLANNSVGGNGACPVIGPEGIYYMFWRDSYQDSLWISRSTDQGANWSEDRGIVPMSPLPSSFPPGYRIINIPSADANPLTGDLLVVWNDQRLGDGDILAIRSVDMGLTWSEPVRVNEDASGQAQFFPWLSFDEFGAAHVVWYDKRENGFGIDVYYAKSLDGGMSFEVNIRVTEQPFTPVLPWEGSAVDFIGDYNGIAATGTTVWPFYQDSRESNQDVYVSLLPNLTTPVSPEAEYSHSMVPSLTASPTPFRESTRIRLVDEQARASQRVEIFSVSGRHLRSLALGRNSSVNWDGRDEQGRALPAGVYYARLSASETGGIRLVRLR